MPRVDYEVVLDRLIGALRRLSGDEYLDKDEFMIEYSVSESTYNRMVCSIKKHINLIRDGRYNNRLRVDWDNRTRNQYILQMITKIRMLDNFQYFATFVRSIFDSKYYIPQVGATTRTRAAINYDNIFYEIEQEIEDYIYDTYKVEYFNSKHYDYNNVTHFNWVFNRIFRSLANETFLRFNYKKNEYMIIPAKVVYYNNNWYLLGLDLEEEDDLFEQMVFDLSIMESVVSTYNSYRSINDIPDISFNESFGIYPDQDIQTATIRFYGNSIQEIKNLILHSDQMRSYGTSKIYGNYLEVQLDYPEKGSEELISLVLSYGSNAEIMSPKPLRNQWLNSIKKTYNRFLKP